MFSDVEVIFQIRVANVYKKAVSFSETGWLCLFENWLLCFFENFLTSLLDMVGE